MLIAARESTKHADGFFFWGYNPGHSYAKQDYDHTLIERELRKMSGKKPARKKAKPRR